MEIRHLTTFLQVASMHSFTRAGDVLGYTQANVSFQIRQLENEVGVLLFDRIGKKAHLTQQGQMLIPYAQQIVSTSTEIENLFREKEALGGNLRIGFAESLFECLFRQTILSFHQKFPRVTVDITVDATSELIKRIRTGQLDIVCLIDSDLAESDFNYWKSVSCSIKIVSNPGHPLMCKQHLEEEDLNDQEFVLMEDTAPYIMEFNRWLLKEGIRIKPFLKVQSPQAALKIVTTGNYLTVLPDYSVKSQLGDGSVKQLNIPSFNQIQTVQFLIHKNKVLTPQIEGFLSEAYSAFIEYTS